MCPELYPHFFFFNSLCTNTRRAICSSNSHFETGAELERKFRRSDALKRHKHSRGKWFASICGATNTFVGNGSFQSRSYLWRHKHVRLKGPLHWKWRQNVHLKCWYNSIKIHVVTTQKKAVLHTDTPQKETFPSLFIGKWVCKSVRTDGSTRTMWKVGDGKADFAFTIRDTHSSDPQSLHWLLTVLRSVAGGHLNTVQSQKCNVICCFETWRRLVWEKNTGVLEQCFWTAGARPGTGPREVLLELVILVF